MVLLEEVSCQFVCYTYIQHIHSFLFVVGGVAANTGEAEKHSQMHDQFNNYLQQNKFPMAAEMAFELGEVLYEGYVQPVRTSLSTLEHEEVAETNKNGINNASSMSLGNNW